MFHIRLALITRTTALLIVVFIFSKDLCAESLTFPVHVIQLPYEIHEGSQNGIQFYSRIFSLQFAPNDHDQIRIQHVYISPGSDFGAEFTIVKEKIVIMNPVTMEVQSNIDTPYPEFNIGNSIVSNIVHNASSVWIQKKEIVLEGAYFFIIIMKKNFVRSHGFYPM